ncbi:sialin-like [Branchiostoma lanceolatum]|uniref:sialin-like n=1 Tax=Branchiostoma lanceolatum TaxID=7740 RepID=UPI003453CBD0
MRQKQMDGTGSSGHPSKKFEEKVPVWTSARYLLAVLGSFGFFTAYAMRVNLSVAMVAMVNHTQKAALNGSEDCVPNVNTTGQDKPGEFGWDSGEQSIILGAFFYGYIVTQIPGGWLAGRYGGKLVYGLGILCTALFTLVTPVAARADKYLFIAVRVVQGLGEGVTFPAMHAMWKGWAPPIERSKLITITYSGAHLGTVFSLPISGLLCDHFGWPSVFYAFGALGCVWFVLWMLMVHNTPEEHPRISYVEREYIQGELRREGTTGKNSSIPWLTFATSAPVWAIVLSHFSNNWGFYTLLTDLPTYMKEILLFDLTQAGFLSAVPYLCIWLVIISGGQLADFLRENKFLSTTAVRKVFNCFGLVLPGVFMVATGYVDCSQQVLAIVFLTLSVAMGGLCMSGFNVNHLDIAPRYAGVLMGISNCAATIPGFAGPAVVGILTKHANTWITRKHQWQIVFYITAGINAFGTITYLLMGDGTVQPWAKNQTEEKRTVPTDEEREKLVVNEEDTDPRTYGFVAHDHNA